MYQYGNLAREYQQQKTYLPDQRQQRNRIQPKQIEPKREQRPQQQVQHKSLLTPVEKGVYLIFAVMILAVLGVMVMNSATISQLSYEAQFLERELTNIEERNSELRLQIAQNSSPDRIKEVAEKNGLLVGSQVRVLSISMIEGQEQMTSLEGSSNSNADQ